MVILPPFLFDMNITTKYVFDKVTIKTFGDDTKYLSEGGEVIYDNST